MIVFPCHHTGGDLIDRAVKAARYYMADEPILVVDSDSPDRSYMTRLPGGVHVADVANRHFATGAYLWARAFEPADFYYLLHDSLIIRGDLTDLRERAVTAVRWFPVPGTGWGYDADGTPLERWAHQKWAYGLYGGPWLAEFKGLFGPMVAISGTVFDQLDRWVGAVKAETKHQECGLERLWGMALTGLGHDLADNALQGEMGDFFGDYPTDRVEKVHAGRL